MPQGGVSKRAGGQFFGQPQFPEQAVRIFTVERGGTESDLLIELGAGYMRFWQDGVQVMDAIIPVNPYELTTDYKETDLPDMRFTQKNERFVLLSENHPPQIFVVNTVQDITQEYVPQYKVPLRKYEDSLSPGSTDQVFDITFTGFANNATWTTEQNKIVNTQNLLAQIGNSAIKNAGGFVGSIIGGIVTANQKKITEYKWSSASTAVVETNIRRSITEGQFVTEGDVTVAFQAGSTFRVTITGSNRDVDIELFPSDPADSIAIVTVTAGEAGEEPAWSFPQVVTYDPGAGTRYYQCLNPVKSATTPDVDTTNWSDLGTTAPAWESWQASEAWDSAVAYGPWDRGFPGVGIFHQQRLTLARAPYAGGTIWGSRLVDYTDFLVAPNENEPYTFDLSTKESVTVAWLESNLGLTLGTSAGDWGLNSGGSLVSSLNPGVRRETARKSRFANAIMVGQDVLYIEEGGRKLRRLQRSIQTESFDSADVSWIAEHITQRKIARLELMHVPETIVWMFMDDGSLVGLLYLPELDQLAWFDCPTDGDVVDISHVFEESTGEDRIVMVVDRRDPNAPGTQKLLFESMPYPYEDRIFLDSWITDTYDDDADPDTTTIIGLDHLEGQLVTVIAKNTGSTGDGYVQGQYTVAAGRIIVDEQIDEYWVGLSYDATLRTNEVVGDGSWIVTGRRWVQLFVRMNSSYLPLVNGELPAGRDVDAPMNQVDNPKSGDYQVNTLGYDDKGIVTIVQSEPKHTEVTSLFGQLDITND